MIDGARLSRAWLKLAFGVGCLGVVALIAVGCGGDNDEGDGGGGGQLEAFTLTLPFQDSIIWSGYEIARGPEGPIQVDAGLDAKTQAAEGNSATVQQLISGRVDYAITGAPELFVANARGHELTGIASLYDDVFTIVATTDSGTKSIEDLKGKAIGVTDLGGGEIPLVNAALSDAGLTPKENVELKVVGPGGATALNALKSGEVAAFGGAINDLVPLESEGLRFQVILPDKFTHLPSDYLAVRPEVLEDEAQMDKLIAFMKAWYTGVVFGDEHPQEGLARICELVPEDCQDPQFAEGFYKSAVEIAIDESKRGGCPDYTQLGVVRDAVASVDVPEATNINPEDIFPDDVCQDMVPSDDDVAAFEERVGVSD